MTVRRPKTRLRDRTRRTKVRRGWCRKNLHRLVGANVTTLADGRRNCHACRQNGRRTYIESLVTEMGYCRIKCLVRGCRGSTLRAPGREPYICRRHQIVLPEVA